MKYRLLNNKKGVLLNRTPEDISKGLIIEFEGECREREAVINTGERIIYRDISSGSCVIQSNYINPGQMKISVCDKKKGEEIKCDGLVIVKNTGGAFAFIDPEEFEKEIPELRIKMDEVETMLSETIKILNNLNRRLEEIFDGYEEL